MALKWDAATMSTGVDEVDRQHRELIDHINELFELMRRGEGRTGITDFVDFLADYAQEHFRHEEGCMVAYRCPVASANKLAHMQFSRLLQDYRKRLDEEGPTGSLVIEVQQNVSTWIRDHIVRTDTHLRNCVPAGAV